jgi:hypothetical protein
MINGEYVRKQTEAIMAYLKVLALHLPSKYDENNNKSQSRFSVTHIKF